MRNYLKLIIVLITFCIQGMGYSQSLYPKIENNIFHGNFHVAESLIAFQLKQNPTNKEQTILLLHKGDIFKLEGDIDGALVFWLQSNEYRTKAYPKNDYHLAWNYALLSNYYYEKINSPLAKLYADSCQLLMTKLSIDQQKDIEIYKIWNILAQSYKQSIDSRLSSEEKVNFYNNVIRPYYFKSIAFQEKYKTSKHTLAKTYHLLANTYIDVINFEYSISNEKGLDCYKKGNQYFERAISLLKKEKDINIHLGVIYFVRTFFYRYTRFEKIPNSEVLAEADFNNSLTAFGINISNTSTKTLETVPKKENLLMCLKHYTLFLIQEYNRTKESCYLNKAAKANIIANKLWELIYKEFTSSNTNQNLAIYNLIPFEETINIELLKKEANLDWSLNTIFKANCKLKYYDLIKINSIQINNNCFLKDIQNKLKLKELYLEFLIDNTHLIFITQDSVWMKENIIIGKEVEILKKSIIEQNYNNYTSNAAKIYETLFSEVKLENYKRMIVCPTGIFTNFPFEALLVSKQNIELKDYRKLDYLINHIEIEYCLSPLFFRNKQQAKPKKFKIDAFAPFNAKLNLSELPFSETLVKELGQQNNVKGYIKEDATASSFLSSQSSILHISSHGLIDQEYSSNSGLVFCDTILYHEKLINSNLNPSLVVLNTCNSALGKYYVGDGVDGFVRAFHSIGTPNTLSNIWEVDDKQSNQLLADFYANLENGASTTKALHQAKVNSINNAPNSNLAAPYYWSGHQLIGEDVLFDKQSNYWWFWFVCVGTVLLGLGFWRWRR